MVWHLSAAGRDACLIPPGGLLEHPSRAQSAWPAGPAVPLVCTALHRLGPGRAGRPPTACSASRPRSSPACRWATVPICSNRAEAGATWPYGWTFKYVKLWAGTCGKSCPQPWSARSYAKPWPCAGPWPSSLCITPRAARNRPPYSRTYPPGTGPSKAGAGVATATTIPAPNRSGAGLKPNCSTRANFLIWPRPGSQSVTT